MSDTCKKLVTLRTGFQERGRKGRTREGKLELGIFDAILQAMEKQLWNDFKQVRDVVRLVIKLI